MQFCCMKFLVPVLLLLSAFAANAQNITPAQAKDSIGKMVTVCCEVKSTYLNPKSNTTYLNLGAAYPNQDLTVVIFADDASKFKEIPSVMFANQNICITGVVKLYKEKPEIILSDPSKITVK